LDDGAKRFENESSSTDDEDEMAASGHLDDGERISLGLVCGTQRVCTRAVEANLDFELTFTTHSWRS